MGSASHCFHEMLLQKSPAEYTRSHPVYATYYTLTNAFHRVSITSVIYSVVFGGGGGCGGGGRWGIFAVVSITPPHG